MSPAAPAGHVPAPIKAGSARPRSWAQAGGFGAVFTNIRETSIYISIIFLYVRVPVYTQVYLYIYVCAYTYLHTYIHTDILTYIHTYSHTNKHTYIITYTHIHAYIRTHIHTYIRTYIHT